MVYPSVYPLLYPQATVVRHGIGNGTVVVEFGPRGPIYILAADGTVTETSQVPARGDGISHPLAHQPHELRRSGNAVRPLPPVVAPPRRIDLISYPNGDMLARVDDQPAKTMKHGDVLTIEGVAKIGTKA